MAGNDNGLSGNPLARLFSRFVRLLHPRKTLNVFHLIGKKFEIGVLRILAMYEAEMINFWAFCSINRITDQNVQS